MFLRVVYTFGKLPGGNWLLEPLRVSGWTVLLVFLFVQGLSAGSRHPAAVFSPSFGRAGSGASVNTVLAAGFSNRKTAYLIGIKYVYLNHISGGLFDSHWVFTYRERGVIYLHGFLRDDVTILAGAGIGEIVGRHAFQKKQSRSVSFPFEVRILTAGNPGIGIILFGSLNGVYRYLGGGLAISFGKLR